MEVFRSLPLSVVLVTVLLAAGIDLWKFRIPNALTFPLILSGLIYHTVVGQASGLLDSVRGILIGALPFFVVYLKRGMGAGDIKLMAGIGAWFCPWATLHVIIFSGLATGCYSAVLVVWYRLESGAWLKQRTLMTASPTGQDDGGTELELTSVLKQSNRRKRAIPFGVMVALGIIVTALWIG